MCSLQSSISILTARLLASACQHLWPIRVNDACGRFTCVGHVIQPVSKSALMLAVSEIASRPSPCHEDIGILSQQLPTRPLPVALVPIGYCGWNRRFVLWRIHIEQSLNQLHVAQLRSRPPLQCPSTGRIPLAKSVCRTAVNLNFPKGISAGKVSAQCRHRLNRVTPSVLGPC